jgi:hypothetical protein
MPGGGTPGKEDPLADDNATKRVRRYFGEREKV